MFKKDVDMGILLICENCNWEIIPMLIGAWLLGLLFWMALFRNRHRKRTSALGTALDQANLNLEKGKRDLDAAKYKNQKLTDEIVNMQKVIKSLEGKLEKGK